MIFSLSTPFFSSENNIKPIFHSNLSLLYHHLSIFAIEIFMFVKFLFSQKKHCFIIFPYNVKIDFFNSLWSCYMSKLSEILSHYPDSQTFFHAFLIYFPASRGTIFDGVRARLRKVASSAFLYKKLLFDA